MLGNIINKGLLTFAFEKIPRISLHRKLVPVQEREYEYDLSIITCFFTIVNWLTTSSRRVCKNTYSGAIVISMRCTVMKVFYWLIDW